MKDKILVAFNSRTMLSLISNCLEEAGYNVLTAVDGIEALNILCEEEPVCVLSYMELPQISGFSFARILKNTGYLKNTGIILCSTEDGSVYQFWGDNSKSDGFFIPRSDNMHELLALVNKVTEQYKLLRQTENKAPVKKIHTEELLDLVTKAYDKELFELFVIKNAFQTSCSILNLNEILEKMAQTLSGIYNYDALAIILNTETIMEYYDYPSSLSKEDLNDFKNVCRSDFEERIYNRKKFNWKSNIIQEEIIEVEKSENNSRIESYECFPLDSSKVYPATIHIGSFKSGAFTPRLEQRLDFFTTIYSMIIEKAIWFHKATVAEERMRKAFSRFIPSKIIEDIISADESEKIAVEEKRLVAILIADIRNFTAISEKNKPEEVVKFLNYYFSKMGVIIKKHGGTIDKFMGDAIMALFGAPESYRFNASRAANAAVEMMNEIDHMDTGNLILPKDYNFTVGIGIHYGDSIVGAIGSEEKKEYTVIGDSVNLASRIESLTKIYGAKIIITNNVKNDIDSCRKNKNSSNEKTDASFDFTMRHLDNVKVKGKSIATKIYEITGDKSCYNKEFLDAYKKGLHLYFDRNFQNAAGYFTKALELKSDDKASQVMLKRCLDFEKNVPENWDGSFALSIK
ncbi:adenylate/guanylate cyclase domain-containing protein [Treponema sp.]|uniref:adenylate/guanylate cyclase domain-containing protein n=1 Tax=Treponema sp. TaxID=166 RepID=UPI0025E26395|nr:adenylate/guanylate cyclase domain-containing protein [Treponema sp.]MCR5218508.1 response regulator [Treponema sp.]